MNMINMERMKRLFVRNLLDAISMTMKGFTLVAAMSSVVMILLAHEGVLTFLNAFAMMGIAGASYVIGDVAEAVRDSVNI